MSDLIFSVVIPVYNQPSVLAESVRSALRQTIAVREVIVVDDGSSDDIRTMLAAVDDPRFRLISFPRQRGANAARNAGIKATSADYVAFLDADDVYVPDRLAEAGSVFKQDRSLSATHCSFMTKKGVSIEEACNPDIVLSGEELQTALVSHAFPLTTSAIVAKRSALAEITNFDETLHRHQDRDLLLRLAPMGKVSFTSFLGLVKQQSHDSMSRSRRNYIAGLDNLVRRHSVFSRSENASLLRYLTTRMLLKSLLAGDIATLRVEWLALQESRHLPRSFLDLVRGYHKGRRERQRLKEAFIKSARRCDPN